VARLAHRPTVSNGERGEPAALARADLARWPSVVTTMTKTLETLADLSPDPQNANRGTARGDGLLERSLQQLGAGRSVLVDKNGVVIAGNKTHGKFGEITSGDGAIVVVQTTGHELVVVQRTYLDLRSPGEDGRRARELAIADNRISEVDLEWDPDALLNGDVRLDQYFGPDELKKIERDAEAAWVSSGTRTEKESEGKSSKSEGHSDVPVTTAPPDAEPPAAKPKTLHACPQCGHQW
jgi:hypothetical protein